MLCLWGEDADRAHDPLGASSVDWPEHPYALAPNSLGALLGAKASLCAPTKVQLTIPTISGKPEPSPLTGVERSLDSEGRLVRSLGRWTAPALSMSPTDAADVLAALYETAEAGVEAAGGPLGLGPSVEYFEAVVRGSLALLAEQRFVPVLRTEADGSGTRAGWQPWLSDGKASEMVGVLVQAMPASARAAVDRLGQEPWSIVEDLMCRVADGWARRALEAESFFDAVADKDASKDQPIAMLRGLLSLADGVPGSPAVRQEMARRMRQWLSVLEERGASSTWRLLFRVAEPVLAANATKEEEEKAQWSLSFHLQSIELPTLIVEAADVWSLPGDSLTVMGRRIDRPQDLLLGELGRASRLYKKVEGALEESEPVDLPLTTKQAYEFLREIAPIMKEQGFGVQSPEWWDSPLARLGARLKVESDEKEPGSMSGGGPSGGAKAPTLGLAALVKYRWEIALGETTLTLDEFETLAKKNSPLVRVNGRWVEIRPEDVQAAIRFMREHQGGTMTVSDALRAAYGADIKETGIPVVGLEATGWVASLMNAEAAHKQLSPVDPPKQFQGTLRPYQLRGLSWLAFLERMGLSMCLADDMGLGKTVQLLALLAMEREVAQASRDAAAGSDGAAPAAADTAPLVGPTLLVVPMSVVGNWIHETRRFTPHLKAMVHHGPERAMGEVFIKAASASDLVITTYSLAHRDREMIQGVAWERVVLDEAQFIKNPVAKQSQAVRGLSATKRVALTGTPVENRLSELWSILDFLNPGYLGTAGGFRTKFSVPIERYKDRSRAEQLKGLVRPFILRRLKSDPTVVADLPAKVESREFAPLTAEQAELYESCVRRMLAAVENAEGIQRRGLVLAGLIRLKQICNHPAQMLKDWTPDNPRPPAPSRSGKCIRLLEMLEELLSEGDQALIFTQFRQMGHILESIMKHHLGRGVLFLHGGTPQAQRVAMVENFQKADGKSPIMLVSLKAGGVGLNLTAATHVFHFDRWWNPAVENQATDRAYRIGQTRTVQVHKFVVRGTLEERIDQMIEQKTELAEKIIGSGEHWLTELDSGQLRELLSLRNDAILDEV